MNYIKELNAFRNWLLLNELSTSAIALWYTLMAINNMTGWQEWFTVPNSTLQQLTNLSKQGLDNARNQLKNKGLIDYQKGKKGQAGKYKMISLVNSVDQSVYQSVYQSVDQSYDQSSDQSCDQSDDKHLTINKHKLKQNKTTSNNTDPFRLFESEGFGTISSFIADNIQDMIDTYGEVWVCEAMREAVLQGKRKLSYVRGILKSWASDGMKKQPDKSKTFDEQEIELNMRMRDRNEQPIEWFNT